MTIEVQKRKMILNFPMIFELSNVENDNEKKKIGNGR